MRIRIHPQSLTTGHAHPSAVKVIDYRLYMRSAKLEMELSIQTCSNLLAILFIVEDNISELVVWDWQMGGLIMVSQDEAESVLLPVLTSILDMLQSRDCHLCLPHASTSVSGNGDGRDWSRGASTYSSGHIKTFHQKGCPHHRLCLRFWIPIF